MAHLMVCDYRTTVCKKCNAEFLTRDKSAHSTECPFTEIECPNLCGQFILLKDRDSHVTVRLLNFVASSLRLIA